MIKENQQKFRIPYLLCILLMSPMVLTAAKLKSLEPRPIYLLDTIEYQDVEHRRAKAKYLEKISPLLRELKIAQVGRVISLNDLIDAIQNKDFWNKVLSDVDRSCEAIENQKICGNLSEARLHLFREVKSDPEEDI